MNSETFRLIAIAYLEIVYSFSLMICFSYLISVLLLGEMMLEVFHIVLILLESQVSLIASDITSGKR